MSKKYKKLFSKPTLTETRLAREKLDIYNSQLHHLRVFYQQFCTIAKVVDVARFETDYNTKRKDTSLRLSHIMTDDHWGIHKPNLELAKRLAIFAESLTFANMFRKTCSGINGILEMSSVGKLADQALQAYRRDCEKYYVTYSHATTIANVEMMWENVPQDILFNCFVFCIFCYLFWLL